MDRQVTQHLQHAELILQMRHFLRGHENHVAINKLRKNLPLTPVDLQELERMLAESGIGSAEDLERAKRDSQGLGLFVRSLVGLDREAAKAAFADCLDGKTLTGNQIEFIDMMIDHLTEGGMMDVSRPYESTFTGLNASELDGMFCGLAMGDLEGIFESDQAAGGDVNC